MDLNCHFWLLRPYLGTKMGVVPHAHIWVWGPKTQPKSWPTWWTLRVHQYLRNMILKFGGLNPPPLKPNLTYFWKILPGPLGQILTKSHVKWKNQDKCTFKQRLELFVWHKIHHDSSSKMIIVIQSFSFFWVDSIRSSLK